MKTLIRFVSILFLASLAYSEETPKLTLAEDGFPTGQSTPEGAACDLARSFINLDSKKFLEVCVPNIRSDAPVGKKYNDFIEMVIEGNKKEKESGKPHPQSPAKIGKVFSARHLSMNGPSSFGYAAYNFHDVMFVDIGAYLHDGSRSLNRTMVVKTKDGKWYVHPCPEIQPLLSMGLNDESESTEDFKIKYKTEVEQ